MRAIPELLFRYCSHHAGRRTNLTSHIPPASEAAGHLEINGMADPGKIELESAIQSIQQGEFARAEKILLQITAREPTNFDANHMLGIVSTELNKFEQADKFFKNSLSINAKNPSVQKLRIFSNKGQAI